MRRQQFYQQNQISFFIALRSRFIIIMASTLPTSFNMRQSTFNDVMPTGHRVAKHVLFRLASYLPKTLNLRTKMISMIFVL